MKQRLLPIVAAGLVLGASLAAVVQPAFDSTRAFDQLRKIVAFGPRPAGSPALESTRRYLRDQVSAAGVATTDQPFEATTPMGPVKMTNLVATIPGARPERIVIGGHYDTKLFPQFPFVGANDAGSSTAFLLEMARVLKARKNPLTMELVFLDGEEAFVEWGGTDRTYGSRYYVQAARKNGTLKQIGAFILVDMIGGRNLVLEHETNSTPWLMDEMMQAAKRLKLEQVFGSQPTPMEDDHQPFLEAGVASVDLIGFNHYQPYWHTREDTLDKVAARSLQEVGDIVLEALPRIEARLLKTKAPATPKAKSAAKTAKPQKAKG